MNLCWVRRISSPPPLDGSWNEAGWERSEILPVCRFHPRSSDHRPRTRARLLHDSRFLYVSFRVQDRYVRAVHTRSQDPVWKDSCVELFIQPRPEGGYFNFEVNCGGAMLLSLIEDPRRTDGGFARCRMVEDAWMERISIYHSLPQRVEPEIVEPLDWVVQYAVPFELFEAYLRRRVRPDGESWRGNLYKCGDETSHPHWASWSPIGEELDFHRPNTFGVIAFSD